MQPTIKKALKRAATILGSLIIGVPLLLVVINAFDQDLKPEAITFADLSDDDVPNEQNGYYAWVGLAAPTGERPHALGVKVVAQVNRQLQSGKFVATGDPISLLGTNAQKFEGDVFRICGHDSKDCLVRYRDKANDIKEWIRKNKILLSRYRSLYNYPQFRETILPRIKAPIFSEPARVGTLLRAQQALIAIDGSPSTAIQNLRADSAYWHLVLEQSRSLIVRMIAVAVIHRNAQLVSEIVSTYPVDLQTLDSASKAVRQLSIAEQNLAKVFRYEFAYGMHIFDEFRQYANESGADCPYDSLLYCIPFTRFGNLLLKPNATTNLHYEIFCRAVERNRFPASDFVKAVRERQALDAGRPVWPWCWHCVYNPTGKLFAAQAPSYDNFTFRIHNLDGFLRLVSLQIATKRSGIRDSAMEKFLAGTTPDLRNPYTGEPMQWDVASRTIYFNGYEEKSDEVLFSKRIEVRLSPLML